VTYHALPVADRPELRIARFERITRDLHPHEPALDSLLLNAPEGRLADEIGFLIQIDQPIESECEWVVVQRDVGDVGK
jgi:hypothetical protein